MYAYSGKDLIHVIGWTAEQVNEQQIYYTNSNSNTY